MDGIFNVHKRTGMTSHDVVAQMRKLLQQKRIGHAGTLDPAASGVLPICAGQATRVAEYLSESGKAYQATLVFGYETDTYDAEGEVVGVYPVCDLQRADIEAALLHFRGQQMQTPPRYSAIKIQGQAAYKRARAGEDVVLAPRSIEITHLEIVDWQAPRLVLAVECSKGTYIRSLAHDLGQSLACGAHLAGLVRARSGPLCLDESLTLEELARASAQGRLAQCAHPADYALAHYPALHLDEAQAARVTCGNPFSCEIPHTVRSLARVYNPAGQFIAIAHWQPDAGRWQPQKVFAQV
jgi:tRNA pseudouridine55 synthase